MRSSSIDRPFQHYLGFLLGKSEITPLMYSLKRQSDKSSVISEVLNQNEMKCVKKTTSFLTKSKKKQMNESSNIGFNFYLEAV